MSANDVQEGGNHYKKENARGNPQHWDLAIMYQWDPFQYQITKYIMRWKDKHATPEQRLTDLKKGLHFYQKYVENWEKYDSGKGRVSEAFSKAQTVQEALDHVKGHLTSALKTADNGSEKMVFITNTQGVLDQNWSIEGYLGNGMNVYKCRHCRMEIPCVDIAEAYKKHSACSLAHSHFATP